MSLLQVCECDSCKIVCFLDRDETLFDFLRKQGWQEKFLHNKIDWWYEYYCECCWKKKNKKKPKKRGCK